MPLIRSDERRVLLDKFIIIKIYTKYPYPNGTPLENKWEFDTARDVAFFMYGRWSDKYVVYKNGDYAPFIYQFPNVEELQKYLEDDIKFPKGDRKLGIWECLC